MNVKSFYQLFHSILTTIPLFTILAFMTWPSVVICGWDRQVTGIVKDERGPIANAVVRIQTTEYYCVTDESGRFSLHIPSHLPLPLKLTAWSQGYYCGGPVELTKTHHHLVIELHAYPTVDNTSYRWLPSLDNTHNGHGENQACHLCHSSKGANLDYLLPVDEWMKDAHSQSARNSRFLSIYAGTDTKGNKSPDTRYVYERDYGKVPLPPAEGKS